MKTIPVLLIALITVFTLAQAGYCDDVVTTVSQFYELVEKGDLETLFSYVPMEIVKKIAETENHEGIGGDLGIIIDVAGAVHEKLATVKFQNFQVTVENTTKTTATARAKYDLHTMVNNQADQGKGNDTISLVKSGEKWLIEKIINE